MEPDSARWIGSMPEVYERCLVTPVFAPFATELARRTARGDPRRVLELAAGTGAVTTELVAACPHAEITATDLNPAMVERAAPRVPGATWEVADAARLPFPDAAFDRDYMPDRVLADGEQVSGDGWTLTAVATPGHTSNHLCFALEQSGALFTGDHVMGWSTSVVSPPDGDMTAYCASLERLIARDDRVYYPAHGEPVDNPQRWARGLLGHRRQREGQILRLLRDGVDAIPAMVARMYVGVDTRLHPAAGRSVLAHLIDLDRRGLARRAGEGWIAV